MALTGYRSCLDFGRLASKNVAIIAGLCLHILHLCFHVGHIPQSVTECIWESLEEEPDEFLVRPWLSPSDRSLIRNGFLQSSCGCFLLLSAASFQMLLLLARFKMCCPNSARRVCPTNASLAIWYPSEFELSLFCVYSPAHALLWMMVTQSNWPWALIVMGAVWAQVGS